MEMEIGHIPEIQSNTVRTWEEGREREETKRTSRFLTHRTR